MCPTDLLSAPAQAPAKRSSGATPPVSWGGRIRAPSASILARLCSMPDSRAFSTTYLRFVPPVRAKCRRLLGATMDAEEVAQETFVRLWEYGPDAGADEQQCLEQRDVERQRVDGWRYRVHADVASLARRLPRYAYGNSMRLRCSSGAQCGSTASRELSAPIRLPCASGAPCTTTRRASPRACFHWPADAPAG